MSKSFIKNTAIKDTECNVFFTDTSQDVIKLMQKLSKTALNKSGKVVRKILRDNVPQRTKSLKNHIASWAFIGKETGQPQIQIGFYSWQRVRQRNKIPSNANPHWIEFGTKPHEITIETAKAMGYQQNFYGSKVNHPGQHATHLLRDSVFNNIDKIREAQTEALSQLNETIEKAQKTVEESEEPEDDL